MQNVKALITTKGELLVTPRWDLSIEDGYVYLEFIENANTDSIETIQISNEPPILYKLQLSADGLYIYNRMQVLTKNMIAESEAPFEGKIYYNELDGMLYYGHTAITTSEELVKLINRESISALSGIIDYVSYPVFSITRINKCLSDYQRRFIFESCNTDIKYCNDNKTAKFNRDFLFSTVFVLRQLIKEQRYEEATRILQTVNNCNSICKDVYSKNTCCCR